MLSGPEKIVRRIVFLFFIFSAKFKMVDESHVTHVICSKEATYPGHMLIRFWCDSDITFLRGLHTNFVTVLYFSIINVLCGAGGDASFAPQANLVYWKFLHIEYFFIWRPRWVYFKHGLWHHFSKICLLYNKFCVWNILIFVLLWLYIYF